MRGEGGAVTFWYGLRIGREKIELDIERVSRVRNRENSQNSKENTAYIC